LILIISIISIMYSGIWEDKSLIQAEVREGTERAATTEFREN